MAEIPAFQEMPEIDTDGDGELTPSENAAYLARKQEEIVANLARRQRLRRRSCSRCERYYSSGRTGGSTDVAPQPAPSGAGLDSRVELVYSDANYGDRIGGRRSPSVQRKGSHLLVQTSRLRT
jgi:hypothetical protein